MTEDLVWGFPIIVHLFLVALGAGAMTVSASVLLRGGGGGFGGYHFTIARYGAFVAPIPVMLDGLVLIADLGSFQAGHWFRWLNLYKVIKLAPMSIGTWLISLFIVVSLVYAFTFLSRAAAPGDRWDALRKTMAWIGVPLGIAVAMYTGVLLSAMPARPFWNSPILALLFLFSSVSVGIAAITLIRAFLYRTSADPEGRQLYQESSYLLASSDILLIGLQLVAIFLFLMYAYLSIGDVKEAVSVVLVGGSLAAMFWFWVVVIGLAIPGLIELGFVFRRLLYHRAFVFPRAVQFIVPVIVMVGAFMLRYVVVVAGQISGPVGV